MPEAQLYPGARWTPLGGQTEGRMRAHDLLCLHTMVGYLVSTDPYFRITNGIGFAGTESHYGVGGKWGPDSGQGLDGSVYQWQDRAYEADANLDGNYRVISIETADNAPKLPQDIEAWTPNQIESIAQILAWESTTGAHAQCSSDWTCHREGIPLVLVPDSKPGRRGVAYHRQGVDPYRVDGGEHWSTSYGKVCPGSRRIAQIPEVIARARQIVAGDGGGEDTDDMPYTRDELKTICAEACRDELNKATAEGTTSGAETIKATLEAVRKVFNQNAAQSADIDWLQEVVQAAIDGLPPGAGTAEIATAVADEIAKRVAA